MSIETGINVNPELITLKNRRGSILKILNFGASVFSLEIDGKTNVVVGPKSPHDYLKNAYSLEGKHFGASVGRHAGRISGGSFTINEQQYPVFHKDGVHLHGGRSGFTYKVWEILELNKGENPHVILQYLSADGEEGYPGNLSVTVKYTLTEGNVVELEYAAETDKTTVVNLTNHTYFNLNGYGSVRGHKLTIPAGEVLEVNEKNVPTGRFLSVEGGKLDFRNSRRLKDTFLDTVFKLDFNEKPIILSGDESGISLEIETNQPAVVVYVPPTLPRDWDYTTRIADERAAICLETQKFPDAPHIDHFPSVLLNPRETYKNRSRWKFISGS